jgi:hypothetical protein
VEKFNKLSKAVNLAFDFSTGIPQERFDLKSKQFKGVLEDAGFSVKVESPVSNVDLEALHQKQLAQGGGVASIPPSSIGGDEPPLTNAMTGKEKRDRLAELNRIRSADPMAFKANTKLWQEFKDLRTFFGTPVPA